ncbi:MAG TPA: flagellar biosynthetic protein FliQ [Rhodospirillaceae bacterium]|nr:MAG: flagellar biosynthetic protein FliQ [Alphaproteobacteria bacterium GWF2_58_20]HAU28938.1 flagellar biosynthetic protein FliQ [Rhodospirillaceae bacterium]
MDQAAILDVCREAVMVVFMVAGPPLLVGLSVGLIVALFQALTQIQETSLTFIPKLVAILVSLVVFMPFMVSSLTNFMQGLAERIATGG